MGRNSRSTARRGNPSEFPRPCVGCGTLTRYPHCEQCRPVAVRSDIESRLAHERKVRRLRPKMLKRDHYRCVMCGGVDRSGRTLEADHIVSWKNGGAATMSNLQTLCITCHRLKTAQEARKSKVKRNPMR